MADEIEFGQVESAPHPPRLRPDRNQQYAVVPCGAPSPDDLPIFVDLDALRDMEAHALSDTRVELGGVLLGGQYEDEQNRAFRRDRRRLASSALRKHAGQFQVHARDVGGVHAAAGRDARRPADRGLVPHASQLGRVLVRVGSLHLRALFRPAGRRGLGDRSVPRRPRVLSMGGPGPGTDAAHRRVLRFCVPASRRGVELRGRLPGEQAHAQSSSPDRRLSVSRNSLSRSAAARGRFPVRVARRPPCWGCWSSSSLFLALLAWKTLVPGSPVDGPGVPGTSSTRAAAAAEPAGKRDRFEPGPPEIRWNASLFSCFS